MAAKRSPILGYNHNVMYRGVVFHVQTEDSGLMNPHLFTHLFHEGVIVSTRKLVYDAGSNEEAIKALMQAQHKAVMKDLMKGTFDEKIDQYMGHVEGLTPRQGGAPKRAPAAAPAPAEARAPTEQAPDSAALAGRAKTEMSPPPLEVTTEELSEPIELPLKKPRVDTGDRTRPIERLPLDDENMPTLGDSSAAELAAAFQAAQAKAREQEAQGSEQPVKSRTGTAPRVSRPAGVAGKPEPRLEIIDDEPSGRGRAPRDTTVELADGVPSRTTQDSVPPLTTPVRSGTPASHGASALPSMKQPTGRPSMSPPPSPARSGTADRPRPDQGEGERPGQYSVSRKTGEIPMREQTGRIAAINPSTISRTVTPGSGPHNAPNIPREPTPQTSTRSPSQRPVTPRGNQPPSPVAPLGTSTPIRGVPLSQPMRTHVTAPIQNRTPTPASQPGSGVVMTRPAVIVGAPPKAPSVAPTTTGRIRKAREDEGRGFGQGLISEKSLDEVILAYLSEDAEDK